MFLIASDRRSGGASVVRNRSRDLRPELPSNVRAAMVRLRI